MKNFFTWFVNLFRSPVEAKIKERAKRLEEKVRAKAEEKANYTIVDKAFDEAEKKVDEI